jgi:uncharacterized delta-60 repeat protein
MGGRSTGRISKNASLASLLAVVWLMALTGDARGAGAGLPDPSFGGDGFTVLDDPADTNEYLADVLVLPDGKVLGAGRRGTTKGFLLARFNPDGSPDLGFGIGGIKVVPDEGIPGNPRAIAAIQERADGKIVAAGLGRGVAANAFMFARYLSDGSLDPTFGKGGLRLVAIAPSGTAQALDQAPDGKLVATGDNGTGAKAVVVRLTEEGEADPTFNAAPLGTRFVDVPGSSVEVGRAVSVLSDGTILVGGFASHGAFLAELDTNGNPVAGFGTAGIAVHDLGTYAEPSGVIEDLKVLPDGRILATGSSRTPVNGDKQAFVARFTSNGELDASFAGGGVFHANPTPGLEETLALEVLPDGRILAAGKGGESGTETEDGNTLLLRLTPDGQLDPGFGSGGEVFASAITGTDGAYGLAVQPDDRAVVAGEANLPDGFQLLAGRFTADSPLVPISGPTKARRCAGRKATITGTGKANRIKGTRKADVIVSLGGNDRIDSKAGNDLICAGKGKDVVKGGKGRDRILGQAGKDRIIGGPGEDLCNGGAGKDVAAGSCERLKLAP